MYQLTHAWFWVTALEHQHNWHIIPSIWN